jgi:hypothetical protein
MRAYLISCAAAVLIALTGVVVLRLIQEPAAVAFSTSSVRI